jgi:hypothetical protein
MKKKPRSAFWREAVDVRDLRSHRGDTPPKCAEYTTKVTDFPSVTDVATVGHNA